MNYCESLAIEVTSRCSGYLPSLAILASGECEATFRFCNPEAAILADKSGQLENAARKLQCDWIAVVAGRPAVTVRRYSLKFLDAADAALSSLKPPQA